MARGFIGRNGRVYSAAQRRAMFAESPGASNISVNVPAVAAAVVAPEVAIPAAVALPVAKAAAKSAVDAPVKTVKSTGNAVKGSIERTGSAAIPVADVGAEVFVGAVSDLGEPYMLSNSELLAMPEDFNAVWSRDSDDYMDIDNVRDAVKKQYPLADVDTDVEFLNPGEYTQFALKENPGREIEAATSNGFYSPIKDTAYLEKDPNRLNSLRATIHELVHDMSDDGVNDDGSKKKYMLNEGYADYVAKKIMTQEIGIPEEKVKKTIGYPDEVKAVEKLVAKNGRKRVDDAFLREHSLDGLKTRGCV